MRYIRNIIIILSTLIVLSACSNVTDFSEEDMATIEETDQETSHETIQETDEEVEELEAEEDSESLTSEEESSVFSQEESTISSKLEVGISSAGSDVASSVGESNDYLEIYEELNGKTFLFSSGAGAWSTQFTFSQDGYFSGVYSDANGPNIDMSEFEGQFSIQEELDDYTYQLYLDDLQVTSETGTQEVQGEEGLITYVAEPHGFQEGSNIFELYLPFKPLDTLSEEFHSWIHYYIDEQYDILNKFGLYNTTHGFGMIEYIE